MICDTQAIVLFTIPYGESGMVVRLFTEAFGVRAFLVQGMGSPKAQRKRACLQPLNRISIRFHQRDLHDIQRLADIELNGFYQSLPYDQVTLALAMTGMETLQQSLREEGVPTPEAFRLTDKFLVTLDQGKELKIHLLIWYLIHLTEALGYLPDTADLLPSENVFLHVNEGYFMQDPIDRPEHRAFLAFVLSDLSHCQNILLTNPVKRQLLELIFEYYRYHIEGFQLPRSLQVFREVLS